MAESKTGLYILLAVLVAIIIGVIAAALVWRFFLGPKASNTVKCTTNNQCSLGTTCTNGVCTDIVCSSDLDCGGSQICAGTFCIEKTCIKNEDCASTGEACSNGECVPYGSSCTTSLDCNNGAIGCVSGVCSQCSSNSDCKKGYCNGGLCTNSCQGLCASTEVCVLNQVQTCCPDGGNCGQNCITSPVTGSCPYCVNGLTTCKKGLTFEGCTADSDCVNGKCFINSFKGNICGYVQSNLCISNFDPANPTISGSCTSDSPYCSKGTCGTDPLNSLCGPNNTCRTSNLNVSEVTDLTAPTNTYSYYCVNDFCQINPGQLNEKCSTDNDCTLVQNATNSSLPRLQCISNICQ